jgi:transcriptional regulator with GAF, ATPase, and Fis domain
MSKKPGKARERTDSVYGTVNTTDAQTEFDHILRAVREADWVIGGPMGAATRLGLKRTTLLGKMRKWGLSRSSEAISHRSVGPLSQAQDPR